MNSKRVHLMSAGVLAIVGLLMCPAVLMAQGQDKGPPPRGERVQRRSPERIQQRIDDLIEEGVPDDDPRIQRLKRMLGWMEQGDGPPRGDRGGPPGRERRGFGANQRGSEEMMDFVRQHPELQQLMMMSNDGREESRQAMQRNVRRSARQISEIMTATEEGNPDLADALIKSTKFQLTIRERARRYRRAPEDSSERGVMRKELEKLVRNQVDIDLVVQELKLVSLRQRLSKQETRLAKDRQRKDELAAKKLERILSGKRERSSRRERPGPPRRRGRPRDFDEDF
ncbi:MAG: hypothetical protein IID34_06455 [Planctomycetes bacterium]|nr:hypothetical protein [Planctomycetota bacterium]